MIKEQFAIPARLKTWSWALIGVGVLTLLLGFIFLHPFAGGGHEEAQNYDTTRFWAVLIQNSTFFFLISVAAFFFIAATTLAMGGWQTVMRRVPEAISGNMGILGLILVVVLLTYVWVAKDTAIYHWKDVHHVENDHILNGKKGFLNPTFFTVATFFFVGFWLLFRTLYRKNSIAEDFGTVADRRAFFRKATMICAAFLVFYAVGMSSAPSWFWLMSIDAHWYSTMYGWYTFASTWVSALSFIALFIIYLKNQGYLEYVTDEHLHDIGKFMFAFSIFWTYLWFAQYMLIWYANTPEETVYFKIRQQGPFSGLFYLNLVINFVCPILILMTRTSKRNWTIMTFMAVLIIFGHWIDFYQMVMPGPLGEHAHLSWFEFGIAAGFVGIIILGTAKALAKAALIPKNNVFLKESIIHHT